MRPPTVEELVSEFMSGEDITMGDGLAGPFAVPELVWEAVLRVLAQPLSTSQVAQLAAGPVEDLLCMHGAQFIDRIEAEAKQNPDFRNLLGGVWQRDTPQELWKRLEAARGDILW